jgi:hypothetical protein
LDAAPSEYFAGIVTLAQSQLDNTKILEQDHTPRRSILRLGANYGRFEVFITEIVTTERRKYRYYVLDGDEVIAGFDNAADPRALRAKYGRIGQEHAGELIPHLHLEDKTQLTITEEVDCAGFISWLATNLSPEAMKEGHDETLSNY